MQTPALSVTKSSTTTSYDTLGQVITYSITATNSGNVSLSGVNVTDANATLGTCAPSLPVASLAPGDSVTCSATHSVTQADLNAANIANVAHATGNPPGEGSLVTGTSNTLVIPSHQSPAITLDKSADVSSFNAAGTLVTYSYLVTNTGNVTLDPVVVSDPMSGLSTIDCPDTSLAPQGTETCTATYTSTGADVEAGSIDNTGTATGTPPVGEDVSASSSVSIPAVQTPGLSVTKSSTTTSYDTLGQVITYSITATNSGNVSLSGVNVTDANATLGTCAPSLPVASLAPGDSVTCSATHSVTQADLNAANIANVAHATGNPPGEGALVTGTSNTLVIPSHQSPAITLDKSADISSFNAAGTLVTYSYLVTNTGNVTLDPVVVSDPMSGLSTIDCPDTSLAPQGTETCTATYTSTGADVEAGSIDNTGTATGTPPVGEDVSATSSVSIPAVQTPALSVTKTSTTTSYDTLGQVITYSITATNSGNVSLSGVNVTDANATLGTCAPSLPVASLAPGDSITCSATHAVTQADLNAANIANVAHATGNPPGEGAPVTGTSNTLVIPSHQSPAITLDKTADICLLRRRRHAGHLQLPGHQHRQRHLRPGGGL